MKWRVDLCSKNELQLGIALAQILIRLNGRLGQNFYTVPEVKASFYALARALRYSGDWMDLDLNVAVLKMEEEVLRRKNSKGEIEWKY